MPDDDARAARQSALIPVRFELNAKGDPVARYHLTDAWPQKVEIGVAGTSGVLMETVTMTCDFIQRVSI